VQIPLSRYGTVLAAYLRPRLAEVAVLAALLVGSTALQLAGPQVLRAFIDAATAVTTLEHLRNVAALFIVLALVQQGLAVLATYFGERVGWAATNALREDLTRHCLRLDLAFHKARTPGELIERIDGDVTALANFFSQFVVQIVGNLLLFLGVVVLLWRVDWRAGLVLTVFAVVTFAILNRMRGITVPHWRRARQASAELFGYLEERLGGTEDIRASGATAYAIRRLYAPLRERVLANCKARVVGALQWTAPDLLASIQMAASFAVIAWLFGTGAITIGTAFMINFYTWLSFRPLRVITNQMEDLQKAAAGLTRITELLAARSTLEDPDVPVPIPAGPLSVEFERVGFGYGEGEPVFADLSFRLESGQTLGLLGRTGSGKTSISRLLFRLYDPEAGTIRLGGVDLRRARRDDLRQRIGMVTQDVQLFRAPVRDNVTFFDDTVPDERILAALHDLGLDAWYGALPEGLDTVLAPSGGTTGTRAGSGSAVVPSRADPDTPVRGTAGVSAGEAQLLAFARVFLKNPGLVILDEASSRLDPATERLIERAVDRLLAGRTGIIIAHRLATIARADAVMILERGRIVELGPRKELARDPGSRLAALLRTGSEHPASDLEVRRRSLEPEPVGSRP
jgi:ABC-type multidrug transport system fused ATPase/permease subunit